MQFVTKNELRSLAESASTIEQARVLKKATGRSLDGSTFLSHSSKDGELVYGAIRMLESHGASVYVDEIDPQMPPYTNSETANLLKQRIQQTNKFVLLTTENSKDSKWVPWELGIADGAKRLRDIALLPASDFSHDTSWASWEYLGLYRRIVFGDLQGHSKPLWMVLDHKKNTATALNEWLLE